MFNDLRFTLRMLLKSPGFTAVAVFTLAIGIGANTLIFSVVNAVLLQPLPYRDPDRLLELWETDPQGSQSPVSAANFVDWKDQTEAFEQIAAWRYGGGGVLTGGDQPEAPMGIKISHGLMPLLGVKPALGRTFLPEDDLPGSEPVVILGHGLWTRRFGADPDLVGRRLLLNGDPIRVVGIMSPDFRFPLRQVELWVPLRLSTKDTGNRADHSLNVVARLKQEVSLEHARVELSTIAHRLEQVYPESNSKWAAQANSLHEGYLLRNIRDTMLTLVGAVAFLLLVTCSNLTNLLLARSSARQKEISLRLALGATRWHLVRQLFAESLLLALLGGALGLLLALGGLQPLITLIPEETLVPILMLVDIRINTQVLIFTLSVSLLTSLILGLLPALVGLQFNPSHSLKGGATTVRGGMQGSGFRAGLVVCETALSLVLLMGAGLMARSFLYLQRFDPGFHPWNLLMMSVSLPAYRYTDGQKRLAFFEQLLRQVKILPGVQSVSLTDNPPPSGTGVSAGFSIEGRPIPRPGEEFKATERVIAPSFFRTLGIGLLRGRDFTEHDAERAPRVVIANETMARRLWSNEDPIGKRVRLEDLRGQAPWLTIVGVAADVKDPLSTEVEPTVYYPYAQVRPSRMWLLMRTLGKPTNLIAAARGEIWSLDRGLPISYVTTMQQELSQWMWQPRFSTALLGIFAIMALILAAIGVYGVVSYAVQQRTQEIGIRVALGAQRIDVHRLVIRQGLTLTLCGVALGLTGGLVLTHLIASQLYGITATDPVTLTVIPLLLIGVALFASYIPARRATRVDPMAALRYE